MTGATFCRVVVVLLALFVQTGQGIDCYKCTSVDGENEACEDPFIQDISTVHLISRSCQYGYFGGTHCFKLKGMRQDGSRILVRSCSDADWGKNCGDIRYIYSATQEEHIRGCLTACSYDGCNAAPGRLALAPALLLVALLAAARNWAGVFP